ncbi:GNAT family N-acetyltransferase [Chloroflexota bacterium]
MAVIRLAREDDIPRILELYSQLTITTSQAEQHRNPGEFQQVFTKINAFPGHELVVAEDKGEVIGTLVLLIIPNLSHNALPWALVENIIVDREYQRRGIGKLLMDYAIARAKEVGCYKISLSSDKRRKEAHKFYRSLGFKASAHGFRLYF